MRRSRRGPLAGLTRAVKDIPSPATAPGFGNPDWLSSGDGNPEAVDC
jgi:hypothetical protein